MFSKIYNFVKKYIQENIVELCIYISLLFIILCPVDYYIITGGGTFDAKTRVSMKNSYESKGSLNMAYVSEVKGTIFTYLLSYVMPGFERENVDEYRTTSEESIEDIEFRNSLWLKQTNNNSIYVAYKKAGKELIEKEHKNYVFYIAKEADTNLKVGDEVLKIDDTEIDELSDLKKYVQTKQLNDEVTLTVIRNEKKLKRYAKVYEEEGKLYVGVSVLEDVSYETDPKISFKFKKSESGPSGGLIMSLQIYDLLVKEDITKGLKIVGTGTIDKDGTVGEIDGIKHKLRGAVKNKADVFLAPAGRNYREAIKEKEKNKYKIKIIEVKSFDDAIEKLKKVK